MLNSSKKNSSNTKLDKVPLISIGITCFNAEKTIERAINSAINQNWTNFEIIIVDDCSTDKSSEVIKSLICQNKKIRFIHNKINKGFPAALNSICSVSNGDFITFFDDDDESDPNRLKEQYEKIISMETIHPKKPILCYTNRSVVKIGEKNSDHISYAIGRNAPEPHGLSVAYFILLLIESDPFVWGQFGSCTLMIRREALIKIGGFDESFRRLAEWDLAIRLSNKDAYFVSVDKPLVTQYKTLGYRNEKSGNIPLRYALKLRKKHSILLKSKRLYCSAMAMARARFYYSRGEIFKMRFFIIVAIIFSPLKLAKPLLKKSRIAKSLLKKLKPFY